MDKHPTKEASIAMIIIGVGWFVGVIWWIGGYDEGGLGETLLMSFGLMFAAVGVRRLWDLAHDEDHSDEHRPED